MLEWLKDALGINRYVVRYDFPSEMYPGKRNKGQWGPYSKFNANSRAAIARQHFLGTYEVERYHRAPSEVQQ